MLHLQTTTGASPPEEEPAALDSSCDLVLEAHQGSRQRSHWLFFAILSGAMLLSLLLVWEMHPLSPHRSRLAGIVSSQSAGWIGLLISIAATGLVATWFMSEQRQVAKTWVQLRKA